MKKEFIIQFILGLITFFAFFAGMFNQLELLMLTAAITGLIANFIGSALMAKRKITEGVRAAIIFASPALSFSLFSLGDAIMLGNIKPFLFWFTNASIALLAGFLGVIFIQHRNRKA